MNYNLPYAHRNQDTWQIQFIETKGLGGPKREFGSFMCSYITSFNPQESATIKGLS